MALRFRKSIRLFPGVRINLSKSTPSVSVGERWRTVNLSDRGTKATVGLPGSGVSYSTPTAKGSLRWVWIVVLAIIVALVWSAR